MPELLKELQELAKQANKQNHRYWVWITGSQSWCQQQAYTFRQSNDVVQIGNGADYSISQSKSLLGTESTNLIYDAFSGFDADTLAITAGTVKAGGLFILLSPPTADWPTFKHDSEIPQKASLSSEAPTYSYFIQRLCQTLENDHQCYKISQNTPIPDIPTAIYQKLNEDKTTNDIYKNLEQEKTVAAIKHVVTGHRRRPLVITADRGRGKTSALGIASAQLLQQGLKKIIVTAPQWKSVGALFNQLQVLLPDGLLHKQKFTWNNAEICFLPIDKLIQEKPDTDLLLVDEAAAIPTPLLEQFLYYSRIAFSTTVQGYEGSGRGFQIRFFKTLDQQTPNWKSIKLHTPIRWSQSDPLETSLYTALLFNTPAPFTAEKIKHTKIQHICGQQLIKNERLLEQLFGLLVQAHYRTSPSDLQAILDNPNGGCLLLQNKSDEKLLAAVYYVKEGGFNEALCNKVWLGTRRPKGHLIPQSLAAHSGFPQAAALNGLRIVRIAVQPELQRQGFGGQLLNHIFELSSEEKLDFIGSSFGATEDVVDFWQTNDFQFFRLGLHLDASSGTHSALLWKPLSNTALTLNHSLQKQWQKQLPHLLTKQFNDLPYGLIQRLYKNISLEALDNQDWMDVFSYCSGQRGFDQVTYALNLFTQHCFQQSANIELSNMEKHLLCLMTLQQHSPINAANRLNLSGKKQVDTDLRAVIKRLIMSIAPTQVTSNLLKYSSASAV